MSVKTPQPTSSESGGEHSHSGIGDDGREGNRPYQILLVEDEPGDAGLVRHALGESTLGTFQATWARTMAEARERARDHAYDAILLDLGLPDSQGLDTIRSGLDFAGDTPVVVFSGREDPGFALLVLGLGIQDYLVKDQTNEQALSRALRHALARSRVERALRESEARYRTLFEKAIDGVLVCDHQGTILEANQAALTMFGYARAELLGLSRCDLVHPEQREIFRENFELICQGKMFSEEIRSLRKDGAEILVFTQAQSATETTVQCLLRDVTAERRKEKELRLLTRAIEQSEESVIITDALGRIEYVNPYFRQLTGYSPEEVLGLTPRLLQSGRHPDRFYKAMWADLRAGRTWRGMFRNRKKNGEEYWDQSIITPVLDEVGEITHYVAVKTDISELKRAELALRDVNLQLDEALEQARAATQAKSAFLSHMSHEIRTPLNGVIGMTGLLLDTRLDPEQQRFAETLRTSGEALLTLINDILDFSKIEAGKMELDRIEFDLRTMLDDCLTMLALKAGEKGLELVGHVHPDVPDRLVGDLGRLRQILTNLMGNAVKFTEQGEVVVRVSLVQGSRFNGSTVEEMEGGGNGVGAKNLSPDGVAPNASSSHAPTDPTVNREPLNREPSDREPLNPDPLHYDLLFTVRDTGIGISEDRVTKLFQDYSQADSTVARNYGGTGLGLAISRDLVGLMGGEIGVKSCVQDRDGVDASGHGSTFWFRVPLEPAVTAAPILGPPEVLAGQRVLVVDDNATNRVVLMERLRFWNMRPDQAQEGETALDMLVRADADGDPYVLALLDMRMPGMDGEALGRSILALPILTPTRLVLMTSLPHRGDARHFAQAGFSAYLPKPVRHDDLRVCLIQVLNKDEGTGLITRHSGREARLADEGLDIPDFSGTKIRVLVVEDNSANQLLALKLLQKMGLVADLAANGAEALSALRAAEYDLVFMDIQMPVMDGLTATKKIRKAEGEGRKDEGGGMKAEGGGWKDEGGRRKGRGGGGRVRIIGLSAHAEPSFRDTCLRIGMDDFLTKPMTMANLADTLRKWLADPSRNREPGAAASGPANGSEAEFNDGSGDSARAAVLEASAEIEAECRENAPVFDRQRLLRQLDGDQELAENLLDIIRRELPIKQGALVEALYRQEVGDVRALAHFIKGSAGTACAPGVSAAAHDLEQAAKEGDLVMMRRLSRELDREIVRFFEYIESV